MIKKLQIRQKQNKVVPCLVQDAALLASFYCQRGKAEWLVERLVERLRLIPAAESVNFWQDEERFISLRCFEPEAVHDTTVMQLRMSAPGAVETWATMCWRLGRELDDEHLKWV